MSRLLQDLVSAQAERRPEATAIRMGDASLTYGEVETRSNRLASLLRAVGLEKGDPVALFLPKCPEAVVGMLGVLKAGGAYVPIDISSPAPRVEMILNACKPRVALLTAAGMKLRNALGDVPPFRTIALDGVEADIGLAAVLGSSPERPAAVCTDTDMAHILFTSGSTGTPKGVVITHRNVVSFVEWACGYFGTAPGERISGHPPLHFDLSTFDIYGTLGWGAELHMVPPALNLLAPKLAAFIRDSELDQWFSVPSILTYMAKFDVVEQDDFPHLKRLLWCGEVLPTPTLIYWMQRLPHVRFTNLYGPTEATIASSYFPVPACPADDREDISIGTACAGEGLFVLDENLEPAPAGEIGDLYIGGVGLSPGYWQDEEKTAAAFLPDPRRPGERIYKTGDLARMGDDGLVYFIGRADSQIKSRGYRIELGEIESALNALDLIKESAVVGVATDGFEGTAIACGYALADGTEAKPPQIRALLSAVLPSYMLPARWMRFDLLPKNANGKIDRRRIRELFEAEQSRAVG
jgi:amino acid adenylation domain-containing protein